jgi:hypothetical protein
VLNRSRHQILIRVHSRLSVVQIPCITNSLMLVSCAKTRPFPRVLSRFGPFWLKPTQPPCHKQLTIKITPFQSRPIVPNRVIFLFQAMQQRLALQCNSLKSCNSNKILTTKNAKSTETRTYGVFSLRSFYDNEIRLDHS